MTRNVVILDMSRKKNLKNMYRVETAIIDSLAYGSKSFYNFARVEKIGSNSTIITALKNLVDQDYIKMGPPGSRGKKPYELELRGLFVIISRLDQMKNIDEIALIQADKLPLVFGKWDQIKKNGLREWSISHLVSMMGHMQETLWRRALAGRITTIEKYFDEAVFNLNKAVLGPFLSFTSQMIEEFEIPVNKLRSLIDDDPQLQDFYKTTLKDFKAQALQDLESIDLNQSLFLS